jgi:hypothetical protein
MTTGIQCRADPRCKVPAPSETGIRHCHTKQARKAGATTHRLSLSENIRRAWPREPGKGTGAVTRQVRSGRRRQRLTAARQALGLCEAELPRLSWDRASMPPGSDEQPRIRVVTARAALQAAGLPPLLAARLRSRLRLIPEQEADR